MPVKSEHRSHLEKAGICSHSEGTFYSARKMTGLWSLSNRLTNVLYLVFQISLIVKEENHEPLPIL